MSQYFTDKELNELKLEITTVPVDIESQTLPQKIIEMNVRVVLLKLIGDLTKEREAIRPELRWFAEQMEIKLKANDHKGGWKIVPRIIYLIN